MSAFMDHKIAFIGFGEAASAFVKGWNAPSDTIIMAYDIKGIHKDEVVRSAKENEYRTYNVTGCSTLCDAIGQADVIFSLVTADQASIVANLASKFISKESYFLDCNSCAPGTKRRNADILNDAGARYVDVAVMAPVHPRLHKTPVALSGDHAKAAQAILDSFDMNTSIVEGGVGASSSIKMIRSIMVKGFEALFAECVLAGRKAGVEEVVLESLDETYPGFDFKDKANYMLERSMTHGVRRASELREVVLSIEELGLQADMAHATVAWQQRIGDLQVKACEGENYQERADKVLRALAQDKGKS